MLQFLTWKRLWSEHLSATTRRTSSWPQLRTPRHWRHRKWRQTCLWTMSRETLTSARGWSRKSSTRICKSSFHSTDCKLLSTHSTPDWTLYWSTWEKCTATASTVESSVRMRGNWHRNAPRCISVNHRVLTATSLIIRHSMVRPSYLRRTTSMLQTKFLRKVPQMLLLTPWKTYSSSQWRTSTALTRPKSFQKARNTVASSARRRSRRLILCRSTSRTSTKTSWTRSLTMLTSADKLATTSWTTRTASQLQHPPILIPIVQMLLEDLADDPSRGETVNPSRGEKDNRSRGKTRSREKTRSRGEKDNHSRGESSPRNHHSRVLDTESQDKTQRATESSVAD